MVDGRRCPVRAQLAAASLEDGGASSFEQADAEPAAWHKVVQEALLKGGRGEGGLIYTCS